MREQQTLINVWVVIGLHAELDEDIAMARYRPIVRPKNTAGKYDVKFGKVFKSEDEAIKFAEKVINQNYEDLFYAYGERDDLNIILEVLAD